MMQHERQDVLRFVDPGQPDAERRVAFEIEAGGDFPLQPFRSRTVSGGAWERAQIAERNRNRRRLQPDVRERITAPDKPRAQDGMAADDLIETPLSNSEI